METRINMMKTEPDGIKAMMDLSKYIENTEVTPIHRELIKIRASQINGCAFCIDMHTHDARKLGESEQRIYLLNAWRETALFSEEERAILAITEEVTLIPQGVSDETYQAAARLFSPNYLAQVIMAAVVINAWNRIAISTHMQPPARG